MFYKLLLFLALLQIASGCGVGCSWLSWFKDCFKDSSDDRREYMANHKRCKEKCRKEHPDYKNNNKEKLNFNGCLEKCMKRWNNCNLDYYRRRRQE